MKKVLESRVHFVILQFTHSDTRFTVLFCHSVSDNPVDRLQRVWSKAKNDESVTIDSLLPKVIDIGRKMIPFRNITRTETTPLPFDMRFYTHYSIGNTAHKRSERINQAYMEGTRQCYTTSERAGPTFYVGMGIMGNPQLNWNALLTGSNKKTRSPQSTSTTRTSN